MECPQHDDLLTALDPMSARPEVLAHLRSGCLRCEARLQHARAIQGCLAELPLEPAAARVLRFAEALHPPVRGGGKWRELVARLLPPPDPAAVPAFRASAASGAPVLYEADGFEIDLLQLGGGTLVGQVLPRSADAEPLAAGRVFLYGAAGSRAGELLPTGEFQLDFVPPGAYTLVIESAGLSIVVRDLEVRAS